LRIFAPATRLQREDSRTTTRKEVNRIFNLLATDTISSFTQNHKKANKINETMSFTRTLIHTASGASCQIHDFGACLLSYKTGGADGRECIFLSRDAKLDGSKAIRGGTPLVFPQFGQPDKSMPQHGFLRTNFWKADDSSAYDNSEGAGITYTLELKDVKNSRGGAWGEDTQYDCCFSYNVNIDAKTITATLEIKNTGGETFPFETLLHTYYLVSGNAALDGSKCYVKGLEGYLVADKVAGSGYTCGSEPVVIEGLTDRVYSPTAGRNIVDVTVGVGEGKSLKITASGTCGDKIVPVSCVVWNPNKEKAAGMSDFGDDQYHDMICVEPGILGTNSSLEAGQSASLTQTTEML